MVNYKKFDVVVVPFPYTEGLQSKNRPAVVLSNPKNFRAGYSVLAMITSQKNTPWPLDVQITDLKSSGLPAPSVIRMKIFTLDNQVIRKKIGALSKRDISSLNRSLGLVF